jgi:hypothetical protein
VDRFHTIGGRVMAKKKAEVKVTATATASKPKGRNVKAIRLDVSPSDYERAQKWAEARGLTLASYARMALLDFLKRDEKESVR